jgi:hypothetical protein
VPDSPNISNLDLSHLVAPHTIADFLDRFWEKVPLLTKTKQADRFQPLLPASDLNAVLELVDRLPSEAIELIGKTQIIGSPRGLREFFIEGATIRIRGIEKFFGPLAEVCKNIESHLGFPTRANLYCTPAKARGFDLHFDTHEVLVTQLIGKKRWQVYEPARSRAENSDNGKITEAELGLLVMEALLEPGDLLYLPRGFVHRADALDEASVHLTIGVHVEAATDSESTIEERAEIFHRTKTDSAVALNHQTRLMGDGELKVYVSADGTMAALARGEKTFWMPVAFAPALRFVAEHKSFCPEELPSQITGNGKLTFIKRLLEDGFLRIAD